MLENLLLGSYVAHGKFEFFSCPKFTLDCGKVQVLTYFQKKVLLGSKYYLSSESLFKKDYKNQVSSSKHIDCVLFLHCPNDYLTCYLASYLLS